MCFGQTTLSVQIHECHIWPSNCTCTVWCNGVPTTARWSSLYKIVHQHFHIWSWVPFHHFHPVSSSFSPPAVAHARLRTPFLLPSLPPRYHLRDIVVGKIYFLLVRIKIKHMEIAIIKKETSGTREPSHSPSPPPPKLPPSPFVICQWYQFSWGLSAPYSRK